MRALILLTLSTAGCFQVPSTLGQPCAMSVDCDGGQTCIDDVCTDMQLDTTTMLPETTSGPTTSTTLSSSDTGTTLTTTGDTEASSSTTTGDCVVDNVWYVDADARGSGDGTSWTNAFADLQEALAEAVSGDDIWIAEGVYVTGSRVADSFVVPAGVSLYGGFVGTECSVDERAKDFADNPTTLSGDLLDDDGNEWPAPSGLTDDNARHVVVLGNNTELDRLVVRGGFARDSAPHGGGIVVDGATGVVITACTVRRNGATGNGGGLYSLVGVIEINATVFEQNIAADGGGIHASDGTIALTLVSVLRNEATADGGGLSLRGAAEAGSYVNLFEDNEAGSFGGGISVADMSWLDAAGNIVRSNDARRGAGIDVRASLVDIADSYLIVNHAGVEGGGGLAVALNGTATLRSTLVVQNDSLGLTSPGALYCQSGGTLELLNTTVAGNQTGGYAAAVYLEMCTASIINSILWNNFAGGTPDALSPGGTEPMIAYSDVQTDVVAGSDGNIVADPLFVDAGSGNFDLESDSPCIDAANGKVAPTLDILARPRTDGPAANTGIGPPWADMGAHEYTP